MIETGILVDDDPVELLEGSSRKAEEDSAALLRDS
jgi:hypothetical protein